jgi:hypothetical protein
MEGLNMNDDELEAHIRRQHALFRYQRSQAQLLNQELDLEEQLLNEYPEMAGFIHQLNTAETSRKQRGFSDEMQPDLKATRRTKFINRLFPGIE